jgi:hypothetical protein
VGWCHTTVFSFAVAVIATKAQNRKNMERSDVFHDFPTRVGIKPKTDI